MSALTDLPRGAPEAHGVSSSAIHAFVAAAERGVHDLHSFMLLRHGAVLAEGWWEPFTARTPHMLFSLSKSFTSTAIGLLVDEGRLSIDAPVLDFFPDEAPPAPGANLRAMRVRHLLSMSSGHDQDTFGPMTESLHWARTFLALPVAHQPGTHFVYNTGATYMLSAIAQRLTGQRLLEYLRPRLFEPLGIVGPTWDQSPEGVDAGGTGMRATTEDIARFGQLYLQRGLWQGTRLLSDDWIAQATARQVSNGSSPRSDWEQGYGYQFWRSRHDSYRGDGAFGQFCVVLPAQQTVLALTAGTADMQRVLNLVWQLLLPAISAAPLPDDPHAQEALTARLATLRLRPQQGQATTNTARHISGRTFSVAANDDTIETISFDFGENGCLLTLRNDRGEQRVHCGYDAWMRGVADIEREDRLGEMTRVAASGAWTDERTYVAQLWWYETPFKRTLTCRFNGDRVTVKQRLNVAFGPTVRPRLEGRSA